MAYNSKLTNSSTVLFLAFNLIIFFTCTNACYTCTTTPPPPPNNDSYNYNDVHCPVDTLKFGVCANVLDGLINVVLGKPPKEPCCSLIDGLDDIEAAVCLCTALKANVLGLRLNVPVDLTLLINYCGKTVPYGFQCA